MLDEKALEDLFDRLNLSTKARQRVRWIRANAPIRAVSGGTTNTVCRFSSKKMRFVLEAEAFNTEYAAFEEYDNDDSVIEFYPQPCQLRIKYLNANNKLVHPDITPDIFRICNDHVALVECKTEDDLLKLARAQPNRYTVDADGNWRSPPAEAAAAEFGFQFEVRSNKSNNWVAIENYEFFCDYLVVDPSELKIAASAESIVEKRLAKSSWLTVAELLEGSDSIDSDSLYALIVTKKIYFDFLNNRISDPAQALLFRDQISANAYQTIARTTVGLSTPGVTAFDAVPGRRFTWDGRPWQIINDGDNGITAMPLINDGHAALIELSYEHLYALAREGKIVPSSEDHTVRTEGAEAILRKASVQALQVAQWRYEILFAAAGSSNPLRSKSARSIAYWRSAYRKAELEYGIGFVGLLRNRDKKQGNHNRKCEPLAHSLAIECYEEDWETNTQRTASVCHGLYSNRCDEQGVTPLSLRSFQKIIAAHRSHEQTKNRVGEKAAYNEEPPYLVLEYTVPRHGNRPFHIGHIDHTPLPMLICDSSGRQTLQTVWLTMMIDAYSRCILAVYLSFDPPSYRSCMMIIRECVRRHGRIPHWIVVDNGSDFQSIYFETLIAALESHKKDRPKGKPKYGSLIERIFNTTIDQFISNLGGATHDMNPRQVGKDVAPKPVWTFQRLWVRLQSYISEVYHRNIHSTLGDTPDSVFANGIMTFGQRSHRFYSYTQNFIILTCPSTAKGTAKVSPRGVKINYLYYRCDAMDLPGVLGSRIAVRYDPANYGTAYVYLHGEWCICHSEYFAVFREYTETQIRIASNHLRLRAKRLGQSITINAKNLASFLTSIEADEVLGKQRMLDSESESINTRLNTAEVAEHPSQEKVGTAPWPNRSVPELLEDF